MRRAFAACALPALAVSVSWLRIEEPRLVGEALIVVALALVPVFPPRGWQRALASAGATAGVAWLAFGAQPWEALPLRDERVTAPLASAAVRGIGDFYRVLLPLDPVGSPEMHGIVLAAIFGFVLASALLVAASRPVAAAAVTVVGAGWPATLLDGQAVAIGALALIAALSIPLILRVRSGASLAAGMAAAGLVVAGAAWASTATTVAREAALDWESWDLRGVTSRATGMRFAWDSNYDGIEFPPAKTIVLTVEGPDRARYWRATTLDLFLGDHWFEDLFRARVEGSLDETPLDPLTPARANREENWLEQRIEVKALVDDHVVAAGTPVALDSRRLGTVFRLVGGALRVSAPPGEGQRYRVSSYAPDPAPAVLAASKPRYPSATRRYLTLGSRVFPAFGVAKRDALVRQLLSDPAYAQFAAYRPFYAAARRVVGSTTTPYATVLALESWFRQRGGFRYEESPPTVSGRPPLVGFVTQTKAGYCQHYAGAMALMLRMLGIPARVAVGFTSGKLEDGTWIVTDHEAHAWVEAWFAGQGWVPFDPTPGRGTFGGDYSFASDSKEAVAALSRGDLSRSVNPFDRELPDSADILPTDAATDRRGPSLLGLGLLLGAIWVLAVGCGKALHRRARYLTRDPRRSATASRRELEAYLRDQGMAVTSSATLDDLRRAVREELGLDGGPYAAAAARGRFGPPADARRGADAAHRELKILLRRVRDELSVWARFRGFVSLRSLRGGSNV